MSMAPKVPILEILSSKSNKYLISMKITVVVIKVNKLLI